MIKKLFKITPDKIAILMVALSIITFFMRFEIFNIVDQKILDTRFKARGIEQVDDNVVIVAIDEKSITSDKLGRWPWPRSVIADFVDKMREYHTKTIGFDIVFSEKDMNSELTKVMEFKRIYSKLGLNNWAKDKLFFESNLVQLKDRTNQTFFLFKDLSSRIKRAYLKKAAERVVHIVNKSQSNIKNLEKFSTKLNSIYKSNMDFYKYILLSEKKADNDRFLAKSLREFPGAVLGYFVYFDDVQNNHNEKEEELKKISLLDTSKISIVAKPNNTINPMVPIAIGANPNIPVLSNAAKSQGFFNMIPDIDGTIRWHPMIISIKGTNNFYPSLSLLSAARFLDKNIMLKIDEFGSIEKLAIGDKIIPVNENGKLLINYHGPEKTFKTYSFIDVLEGKIPVEKLANKIILVGATAVGIYDLRNTPFGTNFPGIEVHANVIDNILKNDFLTRPNWMILIDLIATLFLGLILGLVISRFSALYSFIISLFFIFGFNYFAQWLFVSQKLWISSVYPNLSMLLVFVGVISFKYLTEERSKKELKQAFQQYVSPQVVNEITKNPDMLTLGGDRKEVTIMFSDIRSFTTLSEGLSATELVALLNSYLSPMTDIVFEYEGTVDKFIGDAIMAFFGAPLELKDHPKRTCLVAIQMLKELEILNKEWEEKGWPTIRIGIGINTGEVSVGNMGSYNRFDYTVMGDNVNLASRLEGINKAYGTMIVISEYTHNKISEEEIFCRELDSVKVKGKKKPVRIYEVMGKTDEVSENQKLIKEKFEEGLYLYRKGNFESALLIFENILQLDSNDKPSEVFVDRCKDLIINPPEEWDGVFVMKTK